MMFADRRGARRKESSGMKFHRPPCAIGHCRHPLDYVTGVLVVLGCVPFILGNVVIVVNRKYSPIKTKAVDLTVMSSVGGLIWLGATIVVNGHLGRAKGSIFAVCPLWTFWLQACFGFALWLNCMTVRLFNLHLIFIRKVQTLRRWKHIILPLMLLLAPVIGFSTAATVFQGSKFEKKAHDCKIQTWFWSFSLLVLFPLYFCIFLGLAFSLRNIMAHYNEFRLIRNGGVMSLFLFQLSLVTIQTEGYKKPGGRCFLSLVVAGAVFYYFWARNGCVIYNVLFHKEQYLKSFIEKLQACTDTGNTIDFYPDAYPNMELLLQQSREEAAAHKMQIKELEERIAVLEARLSMSV